MRTVNKEIFDLVNEDEIQNEFLECETLNSDVQHLVVELDNKMKQINLQESRETSSNLATPSATVSHLNPKPDDSAKLPKLQLSKYNGDPRKWNEWWDSFDIVHSNSNIPPVTKFQHMKSLIEGPAEAVLRGIQITSANYDEAEKILKERFAQRQVIVNAHMESLLNLQKVSSEKYVKTLRKLFDNIESNVRSLKRLGVDFKE